MESKPSAADAITKAVREENDKLYKKIEELFTEQRIAIESLRKQFADSQTKPKAAPKKKTAPAPVAVDITEKAKNLFAEKYRKDATFRDKFLADEFIRNSVEGNSQVNSYKKGTVSRKNTEASIIFNVIVSEKDNENGQKYKQMYEDIEKELGIVGDEKIQTHSDSDQNA